MTKQRKLRQLMCGLHTLDNNASTKQVAEMLTHEPTKEIGYISLVDYMLKLRAASTFG
jgi:hypothetical protein